MNGSLSQYIIALFDIHTGITQIPSQLTIKLEWILLQDDHDSVCVTFTGFYCRIWEKMNGSLSQCIIALLDIHTGITQIPSQLTKELEWILLQDTHDSVCVNFHDILL